MYGPIADWDVSAITDMRELLGPYVNLNCFQCNNFNANISNWDTSGVTDMSYMFYGVSGFNQPLNFDTSKVTDMSFMFQKASAFNQPLSFDTSKVTSMQNMFKRASAFNQPLSFDTSTVAFLNAQTQGMFSFNSLSNANKMLIRCAWAGTSEDPKGADSERIALYMSALYGIHTSYSNWPPRNCSA
eukprot:scaffold24746_cov75-Phaeocystis_antarctica.AAC.1